MKYILTLITILSIGFSFSQDEKSQGILNKLSTKMKAYKSFYIEFSASIKNTANGTNSSETGKGYVKGDKYSASYGDNTIISNGVKTWTIIKEEKSVYQSDASDSDEDAVNPKKLMTIWEKGFKNKYYKLEKLNNEDVHVINLYPTNPSKVDYHTIVIYISKNENELKKAILKSKDGTTMTYSVTKFTENPTCEDSMFVFDKKKYPGYSIVED